MSTSILEIKGIGPAAAAILAENGITCAEDLAATTVLQIAAIKGFNEIRATQVVTDAQALITTGGTEDAIKIKAKKKPKAEKKTKPEKSTAEKKKKSKHTAVKKAKDEKKTKKVKDSDKPNKKEKKNKEKNKEKKSKNKKGKS